MQKIEWLLMRKRPYSQQSRSKHNIQNLQYRASVIIMRPHNNYGVAIPRVISDITLITVYRINYDGRVTL